DMAAQAGKLVYFSAHPRGAVSALTLAYLFIKAFFMLGVTLVERKGCLPWNMGGEKCTGLAGGPLSLFLLHI
ncbi:hypothetical protein Q2436_24485, partial [Escherichia coli]|nr:hypothetical protein [Escherichia coli]